MDKEVINSILAKYKEVYPKWKNKIREENPDLSDEEVEIKTIQWILSDLPDKEKMQELLKKAFS